MISKIKSRAHWAVGIGALLVLFNVSQIKDYHFVGVTGLEDADKQVISRLTDEYISGFKRIKLFFDEKAFEDHLLHEASFISSAEVSTNFISSSLSIRVSPKKPLYSYVTDRKTTASDLWVAQDGTLISLTSDQQLLVGDTTTTPVRIIDLAGVRYLEGEAVIPLDTLDYISGLSSDLTLLEKQVSYIEITANPRELRLGLIGEGYYVLVSTERPVESIISDLKVVLKQVGDSNKSIKKYVDLRVVDKAFYQ